MEKNEKKEKRGFWDFVYDRPLTTLGLAMVGSSLVQGIFHAIFGRND